MLAPPVALGDYTLLEPFPAAGRGAYLAEHRLDRQRVLVRCFSRTQAEFGQWERFRREARGAATLNLCQVVRLFAVDEADGQHYAAMEFVAGPSLQDLVQSQGALPPWEAARLIREAALALHHVHLAGLAHRDLRPRKLLIEPTGAIKLLGSGLVRFVQEMQNPLRLQDDVAMLNVADYLAPECPIDLLATDIRVDLYSLGCIFYFCLTGHPPYPQGTVAQKLIWHQVRQPAPVTQVRGDVPAGLLAILQRLLAKNREQRYQTPADVVQAFTNLQRADSQGTGTGMLRRSLRALGFGRVAAVANQPPPGAFLPALGQAVSPVWPAVVRELAQALADGSDCAFALHDALLECGQPLAAAHFQPVAGKHGPDCAVVRAILDGAGANDGA